MGSDEQLGEQPETTPEASSDLGSGLVLVGLIGMGVAAFLPWLTFSVDLLGVRSPAFTVKGTHVGSPLSDSISYGWLMIALAVAILMLVRRHSGAAAGVAVVAALLAGYAAATAAHHSVSTAIATSNGQQVDPNLLRPHVASAYGVYVELLAAVAVLVAALRARRG
jgi:hypothetical protein